MMKESLFRKNHNCWCVSSVDQLSVLIDGDNYFQAFFDAAEQAKKSIKIVGFEIESWLGLGHINRRLPNSLRRYFTQLTEKQQKLEINLRCWNAISFLSFERENFPSFKWKYKTPERIKFHHVRHSLVYGSYHEKFSLIDGCCAFLGGMDLSRKRWDTPDHHPQNPLRKDGEGKIYNPVHDIQLVCTGDLIKQLNTYYQERSDLQTDTAEDSTQMVWPKTHKPQIENIQAAISRTDGAHRIYEIENLYLDAINQAEKFIYIENQYLTHHHIIERICQRLQEPEGPEVIIVGPVNYPALFEKAIYLKERNKSIKKLRQADQHQRLLALYPTMPVEDKEKFIVVHSKMMVVDNAFITIGSANLGYRSMKLDSEINISVESKSELRIEQFISLVVNELLAEHLDVTVEDFSHKWAELGSLVASVNYFRNKSQRTLKDLPSAELSYQDHLLSLLTPFVELKYSLPRAHAYSLIIIFLLMGMMFYQGY